MTPALTTLKDKHLVQLLHQGAIGIIPTDTLYGLVCRASDSAAVERFYRLKNRDRKPGTIIASSIEQLASLGIKRRYLTAVAGFWPGPISIVVPTDNPNLAYLDQAKGTLAVRVVSTSDLSVLLDSTGPLLTSSANMPESDPANTIIEAQKYFGDSVDFYIDGGDYSHRLPSTLIQVIDDTVEVLRQGSGII
jgi:L-threonylcarbamoyladenylate synthase